MVHKFRTVLAQVVSKVEIGAAILSLLGIILFYQQIPLGRVLLSVGLYAWAGVSFLRAYLPPFPVTHQSTRSLAEVASALLWQVLHIASSVSAIGVLFFLLREKGFMQLLLVGTTALVGCMAVFTLMILKSNVNGNYFKPVIFKAAALVLIGLYVFLSA